MSKVLEIQPAVITTFALSDLMALPEGLYRLSLSYFTEAVLVESATGATFATQKQESPDAKVSCPSGCCRIIKAYRYYQFQ